jgi:hypothetical protein
MTVKLNREALEFAKHLIDEGHYAINTVWSRNEPTPNRENKFLDQHGWDDYAKWYLAVDTDDSADAKARYKFPVGDFRNLHRSGVIAAKQRAGQQHYADVEQAADELLDLFDRLNAC